jgi:hypothetical protein
MLPKSAPRLPENLRTAETVIAAIEAAATRRLHASIQEHQGLILAMPVSL